MKRKEYKEFVTERRKEYAWWTTSNKSSHNELMLRKLAAEDPYNKLGSVLSTYDTSTVE